MFRDSLEIEGIGSSIPSGIDALFPSEHLEQS